MPPAGSGRGSRRPAWRAPGTARRRDRGTGRGSSGRSALLDLDDVTRRRHVVQRELGQRVDVAEDRGQLAGHPVDLVVGQLEPREARDVEDFGALDHARAMIGAPTPEVPGRGAGGVNSRPGVPRRSSWIDARRRDGEQDHAGDPGPAGGRELTASFGSPTAEPRLQQHHDQEHDQRQRREREQCDAGREVRPVADARGEQDDEQQAERDAQRQQQRGEPAERGPTGRVQISALAGRPRESRRRRRRTSPGTASRAARPAPTSTPQSRRPQPPHAVTCIRAALTVLRSRQAIVIGPTPPGTGVIAPATSLTASKSTSPHEHRRRRGSCRRRSPSRPA